QDKQMNAIDLLEKYYMQLLKRYIIDQVGSEYFISGKKALQIHMRDLSIAEKIFVITRNTNKKIKIGNYEIIFKTISGNIEGKKINLYNKLTSYIVQKDIDGIQLKISGLELSLLESALISDVYDGFDMGLLNQVLKKYGSVLNHDIFYELGKYKFAMSLNRLKELSKGAYPELSEVFLDVIKKNGGLFIGEGLRGF
ncbi:hypothetical protein MK079_05300, partial [Candidatus Gracilibacteria bacterium]|nr:hypothetical protein [Candidatus Gracilibacteria bacterium]